MSGSTSTNNSISSNNNNNISSNNEVPEDCSLFKFYMEKCYVLPSELKNDIIYCQRALRDFLKVHGLVSDVFKEQADADPVQMQRILDELEAEVYEINAEQQYLMLRLDEDLDLFYKKLEENNIQTVPELGNEYISSLIVPLIGDASYKIFPQSVLMRDNEEMLIRKHFLISQDEDAGIEPLKLSELDDNVPLLLVNPQTETGDRTAGDLKPLTSDGIGELKISQPLDVQPDAVLKSDGILPTLLSMSSPPSEMQQMETLVKKEQQRSLLIPRGILPATEGQCASISSQPPPLAVSKQRASRAEVKQPMKRISTSPPPLAPITKIIPTATATATPTVTDFEGVAQSRMNLRQALRRARKTKQQPRKCDEEDALELPSDKGTEQPPPQLNSMANKSKAGKVMESAGAGAAPTAAPTAMIAKKSAQQAPSKQYKTRNAYGAGRKTTSPPPLSVAPQQASTSATAAAAAASSATRGSSGSSGSSDDLHQELELEQQRLCASAAQWRDEPRETRVLATEYGQEQFLGLFGLYTHDMVKKLCQRHSKRKRRTVQNASGVDFHYGQQLAAIDAVRQKKIKDKPEFLLSPKEKRLQAKKAHKANAVANAAAAAANRKSKSKTPEKLEEHLGNGQTEVGKQKCKECRKRADNLLMCQSCQGYYHMDCHEDVKGKTQSPVQTQIQTQLTSRCPQCKRDWTSTARAKCFS
ncbi:uncharacterized protein LOC117793430 [Drosophila innubila]|uniref:uncharacterized protein LOC117793430 n=1 Tax=Drosophila innubila TaxID=198719 RepID=UPI00148C479A|nr:uncharacterized protein LOC117793430 [Drosophila innubila]